MTSTARRLWRGAALLVAAAALLVCGWGWYAYTAAGPLGEAKTVVVPRGASLRFLLAPVVAPYVRSLLDPGSHWVGTIAGVARKVKVHRRMVREAIASALPKPRKKTERPHPKLQAAIPFINQILQGDRQAPRKQRHTAHRIWVRLCQEMPDCPVAERTVREYVHDRKLALGLLAREVCVAQSYEWGVEAQVDWYEAYADLAGERTKLQVFSLRSMASGAAFHCAFTNATQQAFLEAHELAFAWFGGVFHRLRYDNLTSAVKKIVRGQQRDERHDSLPSARTGGSRPSSARRRKLTRRVGSSRRQAISGGTIGCRYRKPPT